MTLLGDPFVKVRNQNLSCTTNITLTSFDNSNNSNLHIYRASQSINITGSYEIPFGATLILDAPNVYIDTTFNCPLGATLKIKNDGCKIN